MQNWFRAWQRKQIRIKQGIKKTHIFRIWGHKLFENVLWKIDKKGIAGGLSLGLFVAFMPTIGFQMIIVTFGAIFFKVNLPLALLVCWVTNPLTAIPIYTAEWQLGKYILEDFTPLKNAFDLYNIEGKAAKMILHGLYLWTGALIFSLLSALIANVGIRWLWNLVEKVKRKYEGNLGTPY